MDGRAGQQDPHYFSDPSRGTNLDREALVQALISGTGEGTDQDRPEEIAEEALELLGVAPRGHFSKRGRRPF